MCQQEQRREVTSSLKWLQALYYLWLMGMHTTTLVSDEKLKAEWYTLVWSWSNHVSLNKSTYKTLHPIILMRCIMNQYKVLMETNFIDILSWFMCWKLKIRVTSRSKMSERRSKVHWFNYDTWNQAFLGQINNCLGSKSILHYIPKYSYSCNEKVCMIWNWLLCMHVN
jgi:hypothetical protein